MDIQTDRKYIFGELADTLKSELWGLNMTAAWGDFDDCVQPLIKMISALTSKDNVSDVQITNIVNHTFAIMFFIHPHEDDVLSRIVHMLKLSYGSTSDEETGRKYLHGYRDHICRVQGWTVAASYIHFPIQIITGIWYAGKSEDAKKVAERLKNVR